MDIFNVFERVLFILGGFYKIKGIYDDLNK